jgi:hypothetical protein
VSTLPFHFNNYGNAQTNTNACGSNTNAATLAL